MSVYGMQAILNHCGWEPLFRHTLPRRMRPSASPKGSKQIELQQRCVMFLAGESGQISKTIVILSEEHDR